MHYGSGILQKLKRIWSGIHVIRVSHVYREANHSEDILARMGCEHQFGLVLYMSMFLLKLGKLLLSDVMGVSTPRRVLV